MDGSRFITEIKAKYSIYLATKVQDCVLDNYTFSDLNRCMVLFSLLYKFHMYNLRD